VNTAASLAKLDEALAEAKSKSTESNQAALTPAARVIGRAAPAYAVPTLKWEHFLELLHEYSCCSRGLKYSPLVKFVECFGELLAEFRGIWQLLRQTTQLLHRRLTLLLGRVSFINSI
jgi:hypothetical protein